MKKSNSLKNAFGYFLLSLACMFTAYFAYESGSVAATRGSISSKEDDILGFYGGLAIFVGGALLFFYFSFSEITKYLKSKQ